MLRNAMTKFFSSVILFAVMAIFYFNMSLIYLPILMIILCIAKFFIVMYLEPDSIWEIIKKFFYIITSVVLIFGLTYQNLYCYLVAYVIIIVDTIIETRRFKKFTKSMC